MALKENPSAGPHKKADADGKSVRDILYRPSMDKYRSYVTTICRLAV
jgi:hypothetical protein